MGVIVRRGEAVSITAPNTLVLARDDRAYPPTHQPRVHVRVPADVDAVTSPAPVDYSTFDGVGKVTTARWHDQVLAIQDKLSIRASEAWGSAMVQRIPGALVVQGHLGGQVPVVERADIEAPAQTTYSALALLRPPYLTARPYAKLGG
jgi:hypothetical protein